LGTPVLRVIRACAIPCAVLGAALFGVCAVLLVPAVPAKLDLATARGVAAGQWKVAVLAVLAVPVIAGLVAPFARGAGALSATRDAALALPAIVLHVIGAQLLVAIALVAGVVPGLLALGPAMLIGAAVAAGARGPAAFDAAAAVAAPRRWELAGLTIGLVAIAIGLAFGLRELLVPALTKKSPPVQLVAAYRYAWINAGAAAAFAAIAGGAYAVLDARGRRQKS
jgi:hypothetical protein